MMTIHMSMWYCYVPDYFNVSCVVVLNLDIAMCFTTLIFLLLLFFESDFVYIFHSAIQQCLVLFGIFNCISY